MDYPERIKVLKSKLDMKQAELAAYLSVSRSALSEFENGAREPSKDFILALGKRGISTDWFLTGEGEPFRLTSKPFDGIENSTDRLTSKPVPLLPGHPNKIIEPPRQMPPGVPLVYEGDRELADGIVIPLLENAASAGYGAELREEDVPVRYVQVPRFLSKYLHLASLPVKGDSMEPTLHDGDLVVCDGGGWDGDGLYVIKTHDSSYVKRVQLRSDGYRVISDNKMYESFVESPGDLSIVGKVRAILVMMAGRRV